MVKMFENLDQLQYEDRGRVELPTLSSSDVGIERKLLTEINKDRKWLSKLCDRCNNTKTKERRECEGLNPRKQKTFV